MALRIPINLATEPFRRDRPMLAGAAAIGVLLSLLLIFQVFTIVSEHHQAADIRIAIDRENAQLRAIATQQHAYRSESHQLDQDFRGSRKSNAV